MDSDWPAMLKRLDRIRFRGQRRDEFPDSAESPNTSDTEGSEELIHTWGQKAIRGKATPGLWTPSSGPEWKTARDATATTSARSPSFCPETGGKTDVTAAGGRGSVAAAAPLLSRDEDGGRFYSTKRGAFHEGSGLDNGWMLSFNVLSLRVFLVCENGWRCCLINRDRKTPTDYIRNGVLYVTENGGHFVLQDPPKEDLTVSEKFQLVLDVAQKAQNLFGRMANILEKIKNLFMWVHPELTQKLYVGVYAGIKFFLIDFVFKSCPKLRQRYDTPFIIWTHLPTDLQLKERGSTQLSRRGSGVRASSRGQGFLQGSGLLPGVKGQGFLQGSGVRGQGFLQGSGPMVFGAMIHRDEAFEAIYSQYAKVTSTASALHPET
ncbi:unnamed protein product [Menidia menidia]|uniref:(Atlantic silverside) hypothetical protein n=1 Tax=Menidia menidia TaxID=238744 RepID=A0A8S4BK87_9TELE|nr:unnamed protein product [Menidia menidia]